MSILQQLIEWDKELLLFLNSMHTPEINSCGYIQENTHGYL